MRELTKILCQRNKKLLKENGITSLPDCDGEGTVCGHCANTAVMVRRRVRDDIYREYKGAVFGSLDPSGS